MIIPDMTVVSSSHVHSVGHDGKALFIRFRSGKEGLPGPTYRYPSAGEEHHRAILKAEFPGLYFAEKIKTKHDGKKMT